jgi:hypothetical protein
MALAWADGAALDRTAPALRSSVGLHQPAERALLPAAEPAVLTLKSSPALSRGIGRSADAGALLAASPTAAGSR